MKLLSVEAAIAALLAAGCVSLDGVGGPVPDVTGAYAAIITLSLSNEFETRTDTVAASLALRDTGDRGQFTGTYTIAVGDSGPFEGTINPNGTLTVLVFGVPPKPIAGVRSIRLLYPWCDFALLGMGPLRGALTGDTLRAAVEASVPCLYQVNGTTRTVHTQLAFALLGGR
jgi:hypothetical protein